MLVCTFLVSTNRSLAHGLSPLTCGLDAALAVIGGKWKPLILFHLAHGARRYGELRRAVGSVTDKVLIQQLKELQADRIIDRLDYKEIRRRSNIPSPNLARRWRRHWRRFASGEPSIWARSRSFIAPQSFSGFRARKLISKRWGGEWCRCQRGGSIVPVP